MVAKLAAAVLLVLCILPSTAPFSSVGATPVLDGRHSHAAIQTSSSYTSLCHSYSDDDDALVFERSTFLRHSRQYASMVVGFYESPSVCSPFLAAVAPLTSAVDSSLLSTVLRL